MKQETKNQRRITHHQHRRRHTYRRVHEPTWTSGAEEFAQRECDLYGDFRNAPALSPAEVKIEGALASPFVRASESTPVIVTPGGKPRSNACYGHGHMREEKQQRMGHERE